MNNLKSTIQSILTDAQNDNIEVTADYIIEQLASQESPLSNEETAWNEIILTAHTDRTMFPHVGKFHADQYGEVAGIIDRTGSTTILHFVTSALTRTGIPQRHNTDGYKIVKMLTEKGLLPTGPVALRYMRGVSARFHSVKIG